MLSRNKTVGLTSSSPTADILRQVRQLSAAVDTLRQVPCFFFFSAQQVASRCQDWSLQSILSIPDSNLTGHCSLWKSQDLTQIATRFRWSPPWMVASPRHVANAAKADSELLWKRWRARGRSWPSEIVWFAKAKFCKQCFCIIDNTDVSNVK